MIHEMLNPDLYHGKVPWNRFEGWYYKFSFTDSSFAFIPGIFHGDSGMEAHAFIQVLDGSSKIYDYIKFPAEDFKAESNPFRITIRDNVFSFSEVNVDLHGKSGRIMASFSLDERILWNNYGKSHRSMGFYNFLPAMECYSQVCAMHISVSGTAVINERIINCTDSALCGYGYIEKNWGKQFPLSWIWVQSNDFGYPGISLTASIGHIPFLFGSFRGFLVGFELDGRFYPFTSINNSQIFTRASGTDKIITLSNKSYCLEIVTESDPDNFVLCYGPKNGKMVPLVRETLSAMVHVTLTRQKNSEVIFKGTGKNAGIEYG